MLLACASPRLDSPCTRQRLQSISQTPVTFRGQEYSRREWRERKYLLKIQLQTIQTVITIQPFTHRLLAFCPGLVDFRGLFRKHADAGHASPQEGSIDQVVLYTEPKMYE